MKIPLIILGKLISTVSRILNVGNGGTWPGEIALQFKPDILKEFSKTVSRGIILVAGTNGKTTTALMIKKILESQKYKVIHNDSGANLLNGVTSAFIQNSSWSGSINTDWGVFEIDENSLPVIFEQINCHSGPRAGIHEEEDGSRVKPGMTRQFIIVFLNLFRDQLDRYGEVDVIAEKWKKALKNLPETTSIILNADDPQIAFLGKDLKAKVIYFGVNDPKLYLPDFQHATDSIFCLNCGSRLIYIGTYYSHVGIWRCEKCGYKRPKPEINEWESSLPGLYNRYNTLAAVGVGRTLGIDKTSIKKSLDNFSPAFGRQEEFEVEGKKIKIFLSKNPAGFNESLRTVIALGAHEVLFVLNDRIPDGRDVSWIWDVDFEMLAEAINIVVSGDRVYDMALRMKYANFSKFQIEGDLKKAVRLSINHTPKSETLYILPTYSAMLEVRKILTGRKIL